MSTFLTIPLALLRVISIPDRDPSGALPLRESVCSRHTQGSDFRQCLATSVIISLQPGNKPWVAVNSFSFLFHIMSSELIYSAIPRYKSCSRARQSACTRLPDYSSTIRPNVGRLQLTEIPGRTWDELAYFLKDVVSLTYSVSGICSSKAQTSLSDSGAARRGHVEITRLLLENYIYCNDGRQDGCRMSLGRC
jgi:hypothetical protein